MNNILNNMGEILDRQICGFHQYVLTEPIHIGYVSQNLCELLGIEKDELLDDSKDLYLHLVHPADREKYSEFIHKVSLKEQTLTGEYRLIKRDGTVVHVRDNMTSEEADDGILVGYSVLTDITDIKNENSELQLLKETVPCGILRYTCEKHPKITYINQKMLELLSIQKAKDGEIDYLEMYKDNIFMMIPIEEHRRFSKYLNQVYSADTPIAGDITVLRCDGTRAHVFGWVTKFINEQGEEEFQSICMDVTERYSAKRAREAEHYLMALADVYDEIFEFNFDTNTIKCLHCKENSHFKRFENIAMQFDDAIEKWLVSSAATEDREIMRSFFNNYRQRRFQGVDGKPPQIIYNANMDDDGIRQYTGVFIKSGEAVSLYCCREIKDADDKAVETLKKENDKLKGNMRDLVMQFSDGIAAFEVSPECMVKPLYASENVCEFFGYTEEEWLPLTECFTPLEKFAAYSEATYEDFTELLRTGEAEFAYFDYKTETERKIKAICSAKGLAADSTRYVMLYAMEGSDSNYRKTLSEKSTVKIRTFGYFDVFVGDNPIAFRNKKSKELFALLVDRKGGFVTSEEAISFLWEDEPANTLTFSRYRKVALRLKSTLEEYGISDIVESVDGKRRIVMEKVECDLYNYLSGKPEYAQLFKGSYLMNYSWGETTLGELIND